MVTSTREPNGRGGYYTRIHLRPTDLAWRMGITEDRCMRLFGTIPGAGEQLLVEATVLERRSIE